MFTARLRPGWMLTAILVGLSLWCTAGCSLPPPGAEWKADEKVIQPDCGKGEKSGSLVVETIFLGTDNGDDQRRAFYLYDEHGRYLTHHPNHSMSPIALPVGRYVVVTSILNINKRVQVVIKEGQTTAVRLSDFKSAPEAE